MFVFKTRRQALGIVEGEQDARFVDEGRPLRKCFIQYNVFSPTEGRFCQNASQLFFLEWFRL